mmetsp:Transcript_94/g.90  ORF Transcript_94/g.90 Transcript_94/m.90 type:complete len:96 (+) Transcript_94:334-621(+)
MIEKLEWKPKKVEGRPEHKTPLLFILYLRGSSVSSLVSLVIEPEFIGKPVKENPPRSPSPQKKAIDDLKPNFSPLTDEGEGEKEEAFKPGSGQFN